VHNNLGIALFRKGDLEEAVVNFREALRIKPDFAEASRNLQVALERQKESQGYVAKSQKGSELQSGDPVLHYKLANFYIAEGKINEAIEEYEKVLSIQPGFTDAMNNLALLYVGRGQHEKALPLYMKLIELEPESYVPYYNLACMYARQNKVEQSIDWLREAVGKGFKDWDHLKSDEDLENIRSTSYFRELAQRAKKQS
jgi:tetratricopeptide (TPR) repeat protein